MNQNTKRILAFVLIALLGAAVGALVMWGVGGAGEAAPSSDVDRVNELEAQVESMTAEVRSLETSLAAAQQALADATAAADGSSDAVDDAADDAGDDSAGDSAPDTPSSATEKQFCYITDAVWEGATPQLTVDYAQLLTGDAARDAAIAAGEEPLDWYVKNENPKLRTFTADSGKQVTLITKSDGTIDAGGYTVSFGQWFDWYSGASGGPTEALQRAAYYVTITDGTIVKVQEVYFP